MVYSILLFASFISLARAVNDWTKPCNSGVCSFDLPASTGSPSGTVKIWGSKDSIADITTAAGWKILGCDPNALAQDIRLVCTGGDDECAHLYGGNGAVGKLVRLPNDCGKSAFARIDKAWIPEDQSIPPSVEATIVRRDGKQPQVKALHFDTNFAAVDSTKMGEINFAIKGANVPGVNTDIDTSTVNPQRRSRIYANRGLFSFVGDAIDSISKLNDFNVDKSLTLQPLNFDKKFNLLNETISCPPLPSGVLKADMEAKVNSVASIGIAASGKIIPPKIDDFSVITSLTADINGNVDLTGDAAGTLDSGRIKIFEIGIPGLDFPGILTVGPTFEVGAQATASLDVNVDMKVGINYHIENAELVFPKPKADGSNAFNIGNSSLQLSISPSVKSTGTVTAHLIPTLNLKLSALGDIVNAGVFLELDASADMTLALEAQGKGVVASLGSSQTASSSAHTTTKPMSHSVTTSHMTTASATSMKAPPSNKTSSIHVNTTSYNTSETLVKSSSTRMENIPTSTPAPAAASMKANRAVTITDGSFGGCFDIGSALNVNAGADADFFGLFNKDTKVNLFSKKFQLFKKCFGSKAKRFSRRVYPMKLVPRELTCPATDIGAAIPVVDEIIKTADIVAL